jgi:hypothetical protein
MKRWMRALIRWERSRDDGGAPRFILRSVGNGICRLGRSLEKAEAALLAVETFEARSTPSENVPDGFTAVVHVGEGRYGDARGHWRLPTRSPQPSRQAIARSIPSALAL